MRKLAIGIIAAGTLVAAAPAMAQVHIEGPGVGVRVGPDRTIEAMTGGIAGAIAAMRVTAAVGR